MSSSKFSSQLYPVLYRQTDDDPVSFGWLPASGLSALARAVESGDILNLNVLRRDGARLDVIRSPVSAFSTFPSRLVDGYGLTAQWGRDETLPADDEWSLARALYFFDNGVEGDEPAVWHVVLRNGQTYDVVADEEAFLGPADIEGRLAKSGRWITIRSGAVAAYYKVDE